MNGRKPSAEHGAPRLRWMRVAMLAAVLLLHLGFLAFLLAPSPGWRWSVAQTPATPPDALVVRLLPPRNKPAEPLRPAAQPRSAPAASPTHRTAPVARPAYATAQATPPAPPAAPRSIDSLVVTTPDYVAGGGQLSGSDYGQQNVRVPGSSQPIRGMPAFRMADPRMQGVAGVVRVVASHFGAIDSHCPKIEAVQGMTVQERLANHVEADDAKLEAEAARYGCPEPLKPGAAMYYFTH